MYLPNNLHKEWSEMELSTFNTVESQIILRDQENRLEIDLLILKAIDALKARHLDKARVRSVVTSSVMSRNIFGKRYPKVQTMDYATWQMDIGTILFLCSDGRLYINRAFQDFWGRTVRHDMPVEHINPDFLSTLSNSLKRMLT